MNMKKRLIALLLVIATMLSLMGGAAPAAVGEAAVSEAAVDAAVVRAADHPSVGKQAETTGFTYASAWLDIHNMAETAIICGASYFPALLVITDAYTDGTVTYFRVSAAEGYAWPNLGTNVGLGDGCWLEESKLVVLEPACPECGQVGCTKTHMSDDGTGVTVGAVLPEGVSLSVSPKTLADSGLDAELFSVSGASLFYDVTLLRDGGEYQPENGITVTFPEAAILNSGFAVGDSYTVYHIHDGVVEGSVPAVYNGGDVAMQFANLSIIGLAESDDQKDITVQHGTYKVEYIDDLALTINKDTVTLYDSFESSVYTAEVSGVLGTAITAITKITFADGYVMYRFDYFGENTEFDTAAMTYQFIAADDVTIGSVEEADRCPICGEVGCTVTHVYCPVCGKYECGVDHNAVIKPQTTPVVPEYTLPEASDFAVLDGNGNAANATGYVLSAGKQMSLSAWTHLENATYKWQVRYDHANDLWTDIQGKSGKSILFSAAMLMSVLDENGMAYLRFVASDGTEEITSDAIPVTVRNTANASSGSSDTEAVAIDLPAAQADGDTSDLTTISVIIQYQYNDGRTAAADKTAQLVSGQAHNHAYELPEIPGYIATLKNASDYGDHAKLEDNALTLAYAEGELTANAEFVIEYVPTYVKYTVVHLHQNVDNDEYEEYEREVVTYDTDPDRAVKTGEAITKAHKEYPGFYRLLYVEAPAAADGSTVIEVYYDREYYLMKFDLGEMGYGANPIYARAGAEIEVGTPTRTGYIFQGWTLNGEDAEIPATMPAENRTYTAKWRLVDSAKVSVVFWGENADDEGYSYIRTEEIYVKPGETGNFNTLPICGIAEHDHIDSCQETFTCTEGEHVHTTSCYNNVNTDSNPTDSDLQNAPTNPQDGEIYRRSKNYNKVIYINGAWYRYNGNQNSGTVVQPNNSCPGKHTHDDSCYSYSCGLIQHTHSNACYNTSGMMDDALWTYVKSDTVTVEADGSTVLNVYYDRTTFTLTFKNGYGTTVYTINEKWGASIRHHWPIQGTNGTTYDDGERWKPSGSSTYDEVLVHLDIMPAESFTLTVDGGDGKDKYTLYYMVETLPGENGTHSHSYSNVTKQFNEAFVVEANYGYVTETEDFFDLEGFEQWTSNPRFSGGGINTGGGDVYFYYERKSFDLEFNDGYDIARTVPVKYQDNLSDYSDYIPPLPDAYEEGSHVFAGWYETPDCTGEQVDLSTFSMPADNVILYAKWEGKGFKVNFYLDRDQLGKETIPVQMARLVQEYVAAGGTAPADNPYSDEFYGEVTVKYGEKLSKPSEPVSNEAYKDIHPYAGYEFIGWFYLDDDGNETAFDPDNIPVRQDLNLYAKWSGNTLCRYNVYFALDADNNGQADLDGNGNIIYVADPISGSALAGRTYTFEAKGGEELYDPEGDANYREGWFPNAKSHSITVSNNDVDGTGANSYTFLYHQVTAVPYTVRYLDAATGEPLRDDKVVNDNRNVIVTESFVPISGYMPDAYQKTLVVLEGDPTGNVIVFGYTKDIAHALYVTRYYVQELNDDLSHKGWSLYNNTTITNQGVIGETHSATALEISGYTLSAYYTDLYNVTQHINGMTGADLPPDDISALTEVEGKQTISGTLGAAGMELNFYYTRNLYPYEFTYTLEGQPNEALTEIRPNVVGKAGFGTTVIGYAPSVVNIDVNGDDYAEEYRVEGGSTEKQILIKVERDEAVNAGVAEVNRQNFNYVRSTRPLSVTKTVVDQGTETEPDPNQEFAFVLRKTDETYQKNAYTYTKYVNGAEPESGTVSTNGDTMRFTLKDGETITFAGLPTGKYELTEENLPQGYTAAFAPQEINLTWSNEVYAVSCTNTYQDPFGSLTIEKEIGAAEDHAQSFIFKVTSDNESFKAMRVVITIPAGETVGTVTLTNLPLGDYTVTEESWSWRYGSGKSGSATVDADGETVTIKNANPFTKWLSGEDAKPNLFKSKTN